MNNRQLTHSQLPKAHIYTRVSTEQQVAKGESLDTQKTLCQKWIRDNCDPIPDRDGKYHDGKYPFVEGDTFTDAGITGTKWNRKNLMQLRKLVEPYDLIIVYSLSRLFRSVVYTCSFLREMEDRKVKVVSIKEQVDISTANGKMMVQFYSMIAEFESSNTRERIMDTKNKQHEKGLITNGIPKYGFAAYETELGIFAYPIESERRMLKIIAQQRATGQSWGNITKNLYRQKMYPRHGYHWAESTLRKFYKRETECCSFNQIPEEQLLEYEAAKATIKIPYEKLHLYVCENTQLFDYRRYFHDIDSGFKYNSTKSGGLFLPSYKEFSDDVNSGVLKLDKESLVSFNEGKIVTIEDLEDKVPVIQRVKAHPIFSEVYSTLVEDLETVDERKMVAMNLVKKISG